MNVHILHKNVAFLLAQTLRNTSVSVYTVLGRLHVYGQISLFSSSCIVLESTCGNSPRAVISEACASRVPAVMNNQILIKAISLRETQLGPYFSKLDDRKKDLGVYT